MPADCIQDASARAKNDDTGRALGPPEIKGAVMPFVNVKLIEGVFDSDQKQEIITRLTDTMVSIEGENMRGVTWVVIEEVASGEWGIGGQALTTADVKALAAGVAVG
jgi:4-oxalocrotonate tautomerase